MVLKDSVDGRQLGRFSRQLIDLDSNWADRPQQQSGGWNIRDPGSLSFCLLSV